MSVSRVRSRSRNRVLSFLVVLAPALTACRAGALEAESSERQNESVGFEARIAGAYEGTVSGSGVLALLPDGGFERQGYFFVADAQGLRPHGMTFTLPLGIEAGRHALESPSALDIGTVASVRVDRDQGSSVASYDRATEGFLNLTAFPSSEDVLSGSAVSGDFEFETQNSEGEKIQVSGTFAFEVK